jgi:ubiquinone/menaquinone biosynthesis C-methylase UbiE
MLGIQNALSRLQNIYKPQTIIEVGCGTGKWLKEFRSEKSKVIGIDYSSGMLKEASKNYSSDALIRADANNLPLKNNLFDLIYCVNAIHHFKNNELFVKDTVKHLKYNGVLCVIGLDHPEKKMEWYIYDYFNGIFERDKKRFTSFKRLSNWMRESGLTIISTEIIDVVDSTRIGEDIFNDPFLSKDQSSQLALLSDEEYTIGISKIKKSISENPKIEFRVRFSVKMLIGVKT